MQVSVQNLKVVKELFLIFDNRKIYEDRAYSDSELKTLANAMKWLF